MWCISSVIDDSGRALAYEADERIEAYSEFRRPRCMRRYMCASVCVDLRRSVDLRDLSQSDYIVVIAAQSRRFAASTSERR